MYISVYLYILKYKTIFKTLDVKASQVLTMTLFQPCLKVEWQETLDACKSVNRLYPAD